MSLKSSKIVQNCLIFMIFCLKNSFSEASMETFDFDVNDILDEDLMPTALFWKNSEDNFVNNSLPEIHTKGDFGKAYVLMGFHRKMMNEYLCTGFVAKQIFTELTPNQTSTISRRLGTAIDDQYDNVTNANITSLSREGKMVLNDELLYDPGSSGYKNWLSKTTTLDDIYRQMYTGQITRNLISNKTEPFKPRNVERKRYSVDEVPEDEYQQAEITGFSIQKQIPVPVGYQPNIVPDRSSLPDIPLSEIYPTAGSKNGYFPSGHEGYDNNYGVHYDHGTEGKSKELGLKDVMDIALTTLAFLSFGMFILQVLMCITMEKPEMMMPMEAPGGGEEIEVIHRRKRSIETKRIERIDEIGRRILLSIEAFQHVQQDDGSCLQRVQCDNNNFARQQKDRQKYWMPLWSFAMSWMSTRMAKPALASSVALSNLKAAVFGLGGANCSQSFPKCDFQKMIETKKKRQKRAVRTARNNETIRSRCKRNSEKPQGDD